MNKIFTLLTVVMLASCGQMDSKKEDDTKKVPEVTAFTGTKDWKTLTQDNYSIQYPADWETEMQSSGTLFIIKSPLESDSDRFRENINLVTEDLTGKGVDLDTYAKASLDQLTAAYKGMKMIENKKIKVGSTDYYKFLYTASPDSVFMELEQWFRIDKEKAYVLTFAVESPAKYEKFKEVGENILSTFTVK
jgi:hypothetical protein